MAEPAPSVEMKDTWEVLNKAGNSLMVAHAAGLVTCLTLVKDYKADGPLKGMGVFIILFGLGLIAALTGSLSWLLIRTQFLFNPPRVGAYLFNLRAAWIPVVGSVILLVAAILVAICKFAGL